MNMTKNLDDLMDAFIEDEERFTSSAAYLKDKEWKDRGHLDFWLKREPLKFFAHQWPTLWEKRGKRGEPAPEVKLTSYFRRDYICPEHESVHNKRRFKNDDGSRECPPQTCAFCKMLVWLEDEIESGRLDWCAPIFKFDGTDPQFKSIVLHAGGVLKWFNSPKLTDQQKTYMASKGISPARNWNESLLAARKYRFALIDNMNAEAGILVTSQKDAFSNSVRKVLKDQREALAAAGKDTALANPLRHPYMFRMRFDKQAAMNDMYSAIAVAVKPPPAVEQLLMETEGPDLHRGLKPFSPSKVKGYMQAHALIKMPFDSFFENMEDHAEEDESDEFNFGANVKDSPTPEVKTSAPTRQMVSSSVATTPTVAANTIPCDDCGYPMLETDTVCPKCGARYEVAAENLPVAATGEVKGDSVPFFKEN